MFLFDGFALFVGRLSDTSLHAHYAAQLVVATAAPFELSGGVRWQQHGAALIPSGVAHELRVPPSGVLMLYVDPTTNVGRFLSQQYASGSIHSLDGTLFSASLQRYRVLSQDGLTPAAAADLRECLANSIAAGAADCTAPPARMQVALEHLRSARAGEWTGDRLAAACGLSASRFRHAFREQVGISVRSYRVWVKLQRAGRLLAEGGSLTEVAHAAGFADSAHLSRTFRRVFGITPSELIAGRRINVTR